MTGWTRLALLAFIALGVLLVGAATAMIVLAYQLSRDGFAAWPEPAYIPAAGGAVGLAFVVGAIVSWRRRSRRA